MYKVDLNSDLGESFGRYTLGMDEKIIPLISSANIACGFHASDPVVMMESVSRTKAAGIRIGAHPGFPDLMGFGRRNMAVSPAEAKAYTLYQISALGGMCQAQGMKLQHVKPHGALYNMAAKDYELSLAICEAIDGSLVNRRKEGAFIRDEDEAIARVIRMVKEGKVTAVTGKDIDIQADSVCVHGDGEKALLFVEKIRTALKAEGIEIAPLSEICR